MVVKADMASVLIPELEFKIPPNTQRGSITTVDSILLQAVDGLQKEQPVRKVSRGTAKTAFCCMCTHCGRLK